MKNCDLSLALASFSHHFHELGCSESTGVRVVDRNDQVSRVYATLETAATFDFMNGRAVLGGMNYNVQLARRSMAVATYYASVGRCSGLGRSPLSGCTFLL